MARPEHSIARIRRKGREEHLGLGFPIDPWHVVTAAHVVNQSFDQKKQDPGQPSGPVVLDFPQANGDDLLRKARVVGWLPTGGGDWRMEDDLAILRLSEELPPQIRPLLLLPGRRPTKVQMCGPSGQPGLVNHVRGQLVGEADKAIWQVNEDPAAPVGVEHGFSGGPVWCPHTLRVVGMVVARRKGDRCPQNVVYVLDSMVIDEVQAKVQPRRLAWFAARAEQLAATSVGRWLGAPALVTPSLLFGLLAGVAATGGARSLVVGVVVAVVVHAAGVVAALATAGR